MRAKALAVLAPVLLCACGDAAPGGQVLATVGDVTITQRDVDAEAGAAGTRASSSDRAQIVDRLIDRAVLLDLARGERLHLTPEHLAATRRADQESLLTLYRGQIGARLRAPDDREIDALIAGQPWMFADRQQLVLDSIEPERETDTGPLLLLPSLDAVAASLTARRIRFDRTAAVVDSGALPANEARLLVAAATNRPLAVATGQRRRIVGIVSRVPAPITGEVARRVARAVLIRMHTDRLLAERVSQARARAVIRYRPDLAPAQR